MSNNDSGDICPNIVELNVGGVFYSTTLSTLTKESDSLLGQLFTSNSKSLQITKDSKGKYFLDRDGVLFRYVLDFIRNQRLVLPENFHEKERLKSEAEYFKLPTMVKYVNSLLAAQNKTKTDQQNAVNTSSTTSTSNNGETALRPGCITLGYRGTFAFGRDGLADVKFRKLSRILVCGRVHLCREVFGDTLNESRDPDRGTDDRYTSRFFLKHNFLEQAFDMLFDSSFKLAGTCGSGTNSSGDMKPGMDSEENKWHHYNEFVFCRE